MGRAAALPLLAAALLAPQAAAALQEEASARPEEQRVSYDQFMAMVAGPALRLDTGDIAGAETEFETLLARQAARHGAQSLAVADHLTAFGLALFTQPEPEPLQAEMKRRSLLYFRRAIPAYRAVFGPDHAEVALAIGTYADGALRIAPEDPPRDLDAALDEAHRIYAARHGATDLVTAVTLLRLAAVRGAPSRTNGDPAAIEAAAAVYRRTIPTFEAAPYSAVAPNVFSAYLGMARMYLLNGRPAEAAAAAEEAIAHFERRFADDHLMCLFFTSDAHGFAEQLAERGHGTEAHTLRQRMAREGFCPEFDSQWIQPAPPPGQSRTEG